jgi:hypothetical protein
MKKYVLLSILAVFVFLSCDTGDYPPYMYTNNTSYGISFKTREEDSPAYTLDPGTSMNLDSGIRGRADIDGLSLKPPYITWRRVNGDIYDIVFQVDEQPIPATIHNATGDTITLKEAGGYIESLDVVVLEPDEDKDAAVFTETPSFIISGYTYPATVDYYITYKDNDIPERMYVRIHSL